MRTDALPVIVFDLMAAKPVWHVLPLTDAGEYDADKGWTLCGVENRHPYPGWGHEIRRDHASKIGRQCDRCAKMES